MNPNDPGEAATRRRRILVVDDDTELREALADVLTQAGFEVETASDGRAVLDQMERGRRHAPAAIVLDLVMPGVSGWEVIEAIRARGGSGNRAPWVVVLSSLEDAATPVPGVRWVRKPVDPDVLVATLKSILSPPD